MSDGLPGIAMPDIDGCPSCGSDSLHGVLNEKVGVSLKMDDSGHAGRINRDQLLGSAYTTLGCLTCDDLIIEDGEIVHPEVADE
jgi:hypothetical protein